MVVTTPNLSFIEILGVRAKYDLSRKFFMKYSIPGGYML